MSVSGGLRCWVRDDDGALFLHVYAKAARFAGIGEAPTSVETITAFARRLKAYPIPQGQVTQLVGGYTSLADSTWRETVAIAVYPIGHLGQLGVNVRVAADEQNRIDEKHARFAVSLEFTTMYNALDRFASELEQAAHGKRAFAILPQADGR